jgi:chromosome segregation protein
VYLKKVEIVGFKSFANKTTLHFLPDGTPVGQLSGITAIVGPNGSGKSNVADAIRWAIGEQSSKNLRGKKSDDVIFAGTDKKSKLGAASVTLFFDNSDNRLDLEFSEVSVTRKVYRSGEGEYLINGSRVRLMDVVDLLAKAGVGKDSYSVITQGMSDALLRASALERRTMLEDAAGVKQYQIEKERARRRLDATEENLRQVDALLIELEPHLKNLRRQAAKAATGQELAAELKGAQQTLYGYLWQNFQAERGVLSEQKTVAEREVFDLERMTRQKEEAVKELSTKMQNIEAEETLEKQIAALRTKQNENDRNMALCEGKISLEKERQKTEEVVRAIPVDLPYVEDALDEITQEQSALLKVLQSKDLSLEDLSALRLRAENIYEKLGALRKKAGEGSVEEKTTIALPRAEQEASEARVQALEAELASFREVGLTISAELEKLIEEQIVLRAEGSTSREAFFSTEKAWREQEHELSQKKDILSELRIQLAKVEVREEDLTHLVQEELHCMPDSLPKVEGDREKEKLERAIARLKVEVEHVGGIDPLVVEEFTETEERFNFLQKESVDLREAIVSLEAVVVEMDQKIDKAFKKAYAEIRKKFSEYFMLIFGGGKADMILEKQTKRRVLLDEDEEETEEDAAYGVEITACPPGKKITSLAMLSGGERSLTSLALLFAIIAYNPPPFAVLDEVEAALDEANSRRFSNMLKELSSHTQFIAITHNRETMRQASLIYGVTMGGDGISQLLSVKLDEALEQEE